MASIDMLNLIVGWITDYCAWTFLKADDTLDNGAGTKTMVAMCLQTPESSIPSCYRLQHRMLNLVHSLGVHYGSSDWIDGVALAFNRVVQMLDHSTDTQRLVEMAAVAIKKEAVFALCRKSEFDLAEEVYTRTWQKCATDDTDDTDNTDDTDTSQGEARKIVVMVLKSRDPHHEAVQVPNSFAEMVESVECILGHIRSKLKQPFLLQAAAKMKTGGIEEEEEVKTNTGILLEGRLLDDVRDHYGLAAKTQTSSLNKDTMSRISKIRRNKAAYLASMPEAFKYGPNYISVKDKEVTDTGGEMSAEIVNSSSTTSERSPSLTSSPQKLVPSRTSTPRKRAPSSPCTPQKRAPSLRYTPQKRAPSLRHTPQKRAPSLRHTPQKRAPSSPVDSIQPKRKPPAPQTDTEVWVMTDGNCRDGHAPSRRNGENEDASSQSTMSEDIFAKPAHVTLGPSRRFRSSLAPAANTSSNVSTVSTRRRRNAWDSAEEMTLYRGVRKFGHGQWGKIKLHYSFVDRTSVDLKDKWRNMIRKGRIQELDDMFDT